MEQFPYITRKVYMILKKRTLAIVFISFSSINAMQKVESLRQEAKTLRERLNQVQFLEQCRKISPSCQVIQAKVLNQFWLKANAGASCGYLALMNGLNLAYASRKQSNDFLEQMNSEHLVVAKMDEWRLMVRKSRLKLKSAPYLADLIMTSYQTCSKLSPKLMSKYSGDKKGTDFESQAREKVKSLLTRICGCEELLIENDRAYSCTLKKEDLFKFYSQFIKENFQNNDGDSKKMDQFLMERDVFDSLFADFKISESFSFAEDVKVDGEAPKRFAINSDLLKAEEIHMLFNHEKGLEKLRKRKRSAYFILLAMAMKK